MPPPTSPRPRPKATGKFIGQPWGAWWGRCRDATCRPGARQSKHRKLVKRNALFFFQPRTPLFGLVDAPRRFALTTFHAFPPLPFLLHTGRLRYVKRRVLGREASDGGLWGAPEREKINRTLALRPTHKPLSHHPPFSHRRPATPPPRAPPPPLFSLTPPAPLLATHNININNNNNKTETATKTDMIMVFGEITTKAKVDYEAVVRKTARDIGFTSNDVGLCADTCKV
jgi:hypothetical protein